MSEQEKKVKAPKKPLSAQDLESIVLKGLIGAAASYMAAVMFGAADIGHFDSLVGKIIAGLTALIILHGLIYHTVSEVRNVQLKRLSRRQRKF